MYVSRERWRRTGRGGVLQGDAHGGAFLPENNTPLAKVGFMVGAFDDVVIVVPPCFAPKL